MNKFIVSIICTIFILLSPCHVLGSQFMKSIFGNGTREPLLYRACREGRLTLVQRFLARGANTNIANDQGITPLMAACEIAHCTIIRVLLTHQADANAIDKDGNTALFYAIRSRSLSAVQTLCEYGRPEMSVDNKMPSEFAQEYNQAIAKYLANREKDFVEKFQDARSHMADEDPVERRRHERRAPAPY